MKVKTLFAFLLLSTSTSSTMVFANEIPGPTEMKSVYKEFCSSCHGDKMQGGTGPSLVDEEWLEGKTPKDIADSIENGHSGTMMPAWRDVLTKEEINSLSILILQQRYVAALEARQPMLTRLGD